MAKKYDIVETTKMSAEYDASLIFGDAVASSALENGRLVVVNSATKAVGYPSAVTEVVGLHASVERMYNGEGLTEFRVESGDYARVFKFRVGDTFATTAIDYNGDRANFGAVAVGDKAITHITDGKLSVLLTATSTTSVFVARVIEKLTLGFDRTSAIKVEVEKC